MDVDAVSVALKFCTYVGVLQAAGIALFLALFGDTLGASRDALRRLGLGFTLGGSASLLLFQAQEAARMAGEFAGVLDGSLQGLALQLRMGQANCVRLAALLLLAIAFTLRHRASGPLALAGALLASASFTWVGHTSTHVWRWILAPVLWLHVSIAAFWFGALLPLGVACRREDAGAGRRLVQRFSTLAGTWVPLLAAAGIALGLGLTGARLAGTPYVRALLLKLAAFVVLMGFAAINRWRLGPAVGSGPAAARALRRSLWMEYAVMLAVIALTAALTSLYSP